MACLNDRVSLVIGLKAKRTVNEQSPRKKGPEVNGDASVYKIYSSEG